MQTQIAPAPRPVASRRHSALVASGLSALFLAACGGGGGSTAPAAPAPPAVVPSLTVSTAVTEQDGTTAITGAVVSITTSTGTVTLTENNGTYTLAIPTSQLPTSSASTPVVVTISKDGYVPESVVISSDKLVAGTTVTIPATTLTQVAVTDLIPAEGLALVRLGNGKTAGGANEALQASLPANTSVANKLIKLGSIDSLFGADGTLTSYYSTVTLAISFRGLQATYCADKIALFQAATADGSGTRTAETVITASTEPTKLADFDSGLPKDLTFALSTAGLVKGSALWAEVASGACKDSANNVIDDLDDFEFFNVHASFSKP